MKGHISIGILLLFCAYGALGASILAKRDEAKKQQIVTVVNQLRQDIAAKFKIANMKEMSYHTGLENEMKTVDCDRNGKDAYIVGFPTKEEMEQLEQVIAKLMQHQGTPEEAYEIRKMFLPILDPTESQIGCAARPDCRVGALCAVGPNKNPSESNFQKTPSEYNFQKNPSESNIQKGVDPDLHRTYGSGSGPTSVCPAISILLASFSFLLASLNYI